MEWPSSWQSGIHFVSAYFPRFDPFLLSIRSIIFDTLTRHILVTSYSNSVWAPFSQIPSVLLAISEQYLRCTSRQASIAEGLYFYLSAACTVFSIRLRQVWLIYVWRQPTLHRCVRMTSHKSALLRNWWGHSKRCRMTRTWTLSQTANKESGIFSVCLSIRHHLKYGTVHVHGPRHSCCPGSDKPPL